MKKIFLIIFSCVLLNATEYQVSSGNFYYSPSVLEIYVGDTVTWVNEGGYHDVNAFVNAVTGLVYENPENFSLPPTSVGLIGSHTFTVPGTYNYNCSIGSHASLGQVGTIIVLESSSTSWEIDAGNYYYSPSYLEIEVGDNVTWNNLSGFHDVVVTSGPELLELSPCSGSCTIGTLTFNTPGVYEYICSIGSHAANGMVGTISVVDSSEVSGCTDPNAISCDGEIDPLYFPECDTCSDDEPCDNYYNPLATSDNGMCMYNITPEYDEFTITDTGNGSLELDWSDFNPPVEIDQYVLTRCADINGDSDNDGVLEYEMCVMIIAPMPMYDDTQFVDDFSDATEYGLDDIAGIKYTLAVGYPNNNYWGSAFNNYYYEPESSECSDGEIDNSDPCMPSECFGGEWYDIIIDCAEQMGVPCENGVYLPPDEGVCCSDCVLSGDLNLDGIINIIDVVSLVNGILNSSLTYNQTLISDLNNDTTVNVIDIVSLVNLILN
tara:strand:- start:1177 stop:2652 length:1476 start_codon:yes stop_codon:yes gene_type:complete